MLLTNTIMRWEDMVENYPNSWVAVRHAIMTGPDIISGEVVAVLSDDEICDYEDAHIEEDLEYARTSEDETFNGYIDSNLVIYVS